VGFISGMLVEKGLPGFIAYGVLVGEVVAPILIIVGLFTRPAALVLAFTMIVAWLMVGMGETLALDKVGHGRLKAWCTSLSARWRSRF
jgi:putative oxidoreductase